MAAPFLLTAADRQGTLAAARCLGSREIPVIVASDRLLAPSLWSRHVRRRVTCPAERPLEDFLRWLVAFGDRQPGHVLYPASDDLAWLFAAHRAALAKRFALYAPDAAAIGSLLDKRRLYAACARVGIKTPATWFPSDDTIARVAREVAFPAMVRPRARVLSPAYRGRVVRSAEELSETFGALRRLGAGAPMVQAFHHSALGVQTVSGFCGSRDEIFVARAARKILQWPRRVGAGICFEHAALDPDLAGRIRALCRHVGYHGVFEAELLSKGHDSLLIDFTPRFFASIAFDVARGLPSPYLAYLAARGEDDALRASIEEAHRWTPEGRGLALVHRFTLRWSLALERMVGRADEGDVWRWARWQNEYGAFDPLRDDEDRLPSILHAAGQLWTIARDLPSTLRSAVHGT